MTARLLSVLLACAVAVPALAIAVPALADPPKVPLFGRHKTATAPATPDAAPAATTAPAVPDAAPAAAPARPADTPITTVEVPPAAAPVAVTPDIAPPAAPSASASPQAAAAPPAADTALTGVAQLRAAYAFALPVYEMMRARHLQVARAEAAGAPGVNHLYARTVLADAATRDVTTPSNDVLYSSAWLDLAGGPVILDAPALPGRYHSVALMDLFTNNVAIVGTRTGGTGGRYLIVGPGWNGSPPPQTTVLHSPTNDAWLLVRVLVNGADDLPAATGLIRGFSLSATTDDHLKPVATTAVPTANPDAATFIAVVDEALARTPLPAALLARPELAALGVYDRGVDPARVPATTLALWTKTLPALRAEVRRGLAETGTVVDGWSYPGPGIGHYGDSDDDARARVALGGLGALPPTEAIYLTATADKAGAPLAGTKAYTVHLPAKLPVGAFWSLTMYQQDAAGRLFFVDSASKRFAVGDRTPELRAERDGGYDIFVQPLAPSGERVVNWLPSPKGPFRLIFRAYLPGPAFLDGSFRLPPVEPTEVIP